MHANFTFLMTVDQDGDDGELADEARSAMESFAEKRCDENNWYAEIALVLQNGRVIDLSEPNDYRGRDELPKHIRDIPQAERWEWARLMALKCVANEFELDGRPTLGLLQDDKPDEDYWNGFDTLLAKIMADVPMRLSELWRQPPLLVPLRRPYVLRNIDLAYRRKTWSRQMFLLLDAIEHHECPFTGDGTPYDYRAFDIRGNGMSIEDQPGNAILLVDIHT